MSEKLFEVTQQPLSQDDILRRVSRFDCGGVVTFAGTVRGSTATDGGARETDFLVYEAYVPMAEKMMARIGDEIQERWPLVKGVSILHRIGRCDVEEPTVLDSSRHATSRRRLLRGLPLRYRASQGDRADLEAGELARRRSLG